MSVRNEAAEAERKELTRDIPRFTVSCLAATAFLVVFARFDEGHIFILWPLFWAAATSTVVVVVFRSGSRASQRFGAWVTPAGVLAVAGALMASGGVAYTYGADGNLVAIATAVTSPLDLSDGANHTVSFKLQNTGPTTVRVFPTLHLGLERASGEAISPYLGCPPSMGPTSTDRNVKELPPGGAVVLLVRLQSDGSSLPTNSSCPRWQVVAGETYLLYAVIEGRAGSATLPVWMGSVESNRIAMIA